MDSANVLYTEPRQNLFGINGERIIPKETEWKKSMSENGSVKAV
jgi:hypothetical protein